MAIRPTRRALLGIAVSLGSLTLPGIAAAQSDRGLEARAKEVIDHWTPDRKKAAVPRDLVIDQRGLGYLRAKDGGFEPYGHNIAAQAGPPAGGSDTTGPAISATSPALNATIGAEQTFSATVTDTSGVKSVSFVLQKTGALAQTFTPSKVGNVYSVALEGFTDGDWTWTVNARDLVKGAGNPSSTGPMPFHVTIGPVDPPPPPGGGTEPNAEWTGGGVVQNAVGRIYFEMPSNAKRTRWLGYVCSGTAVTDGTSGRSIILTASHCVYDDANKAFARKVMFIPDQADTTGTGTDRDCTNDPKGCWVPKFGVVDVNWTTRVFPNNVKWDYAFYVVSDTGAHQGNGLEAALDAAVGTMSIDFAAPTVVPPASGNALTHALGYSYDMDPQFMYCSDPMENLDASNWWLPNCGLSGGSSGGPWSQVFNTSTGNGPVISVNSWGYTNQPGMAGPKLSGNSAECVFGKAKTNTLGATYADGEAGVKVSTCP